MSQSGNGINLFNGKNMEGWLARGGAPEHEWDAAGSVALNAEDSKLLTTTAGEGIFYNGATGRTVDIYTEAEYGDCELHVEFMVPQGSNSGVYLMGRYEIQYWTVGVKRNSVTGPVGVYIAVGSTINRWMVCRRASTPVNPPVSGRLTTSPSAHQNSMAMVIRLPMLPSSKSCGMDRSSTKMLKWWVAHADQ